MQADHETNTAPIKMALALAHFEDMVRRHACGDRSGTAVEAARAAVLALAATAAQTPPNDSPQSAGSSPRSPDAGPAAQGATSLPMVVTTAPKRIWLDLGFDPELEDPTDFRDLLYAATWSEDNASEHGVEYVRADLAAQDAEPGSWLIEHADGTPLEKTRDRNRADLARRIGHSVTPLYAAPVGQAEDAARQDLRKFLDVAAGEGYVFDGVDDDGPSFAEVNDWELRKWHGECRVTHLMPVVIPTAPDADRAAQAACTGGAKA